MMEDWRRSKLEVKMYCAKHPDTELNFSPNSKIGASSAYEINAKILIHPCRRCEDEVNRIKEAVGVFQMFGRKEKS